MILKQEMQRLEILETRMLATPDQQISLTDPDARSMATSGRGSGMVGYNVQVAVDTTHHLIVAHDVTNVGTDRSQLFQMAQKTQAILETDALDVVADRGYFSSTEILPVTRRVSRSHCPNHRPQATKAKACSSSRTFAICRAKMSIFVRWRTLGPSLYQ